MKTKKLPLLGSYYRNDEKIYKVIAISRATDEVVVEDIEVKTKYSVRYAVFWAGYERVFKIGEVAHCLGRHPRSIYRYEKKGIVNKQKKYPAGSSRMVRFYTLDDIFELHELISVVHQGKPRRDGRITNNTMVDIGTLKILLKERFDD